MVRIKIYKRDRKLCHAWKNTKNKETGSDDKKAMIDRESGNHDGYVKRQPAFARKKRYKRHIQLWRGRNCKKADIAGKEEKTRTGIVARKKRRVGI